MSRDRTGRRSRAFILTLAVLLCANNLLPYLGLRDDSCQTMFSGLRWWAHGNNHYLAPQHMLADLWLYYDDDHVELEPPAPEHGRARDLERWLDQDDRRLNPEAVRAVVRQLCDRGHRVSFRARALSPVRDACHEPRFSRPHAWIPVRLYDSHVASRLAP